MKALLLSFPAHGHTNPSLPLVRELVARGEEVVYYSIDVFAPRIEQAGARHRLYSNAFLLDVATLPGRLEEISWLLMRTTSELLATHLDAWRAEKPDYIITDSVAPWGQWAGEILGIPVVTSITTCAINRHVMRFVVAGGRPPASAALVASKIRNMVRTCVLVSRLRSQYGVRGTGIMRTVCGSSELNIVYTSRAFQPRAETFGDHFLFVGPSSGFETAEQAFPWDQIHQSAVIYISMGTLFNADAVFYRDCFEAFRHENFQVIMALGSNVNPAELGPVPANFIVRARVPQTELLQRTAVFVTHGGMNSVSESLHRGVPMVVVPQMSEQHMNGKRVEQLGAGLLLPKLQATAENLRDAVRQILAGNHFRLAAADIQASFEAAGGAAKAADAILSFTRTP